MISYDECIHHGARVIKLLESGRLFFGRYNGDVEGVQITRDYKVAEIYATIQSAQEFGYAIGEKYPNWLGDNFSCWSDVVSNATDAFVDRERIPEEKLSKLLWGYALDFPEAIKQSIPTLRDEIDTMSMWCLKNEIYGRPSIFFSRILAVYEQGGWPCGWLGKYPEGKLIVLDPNPL
jgi:hypothetical protein